MKGISEGKQLFLFAFHEFGYGYSRPSFDYLRDLFLSDFFSHKRILSLAFGNPCLFLFKLLLYLREFSVFEFRCPVEIVFSFGFLYLSGEFFAFFSELLKFHNGLFFRVPLSLHFRELISHLSQFFLDLIEVLFGELVIFLLQGCLFYLELDNLSSYDIELSRHGVHLCPYKRTRLIHEVYGLIRKESVGYISVGEHRGSYDGTVAYLDSVVYLISLLQSPEDSYGIFNIRLGYEDRLESSFESRIFFDVLPVFIESSRADAVQFASC